LRHGCTRAWFSIDSRWKRPAAAQDHGHETPLQDCRQRQVLLVDPTASEWRVPRDGKPSRRTQFFRFSMRSSLYVAAAIPLNLSYRVRLTPDGTMH